MHSDQIVNNENNELTNVYSKPIKVGMTIEPLTEIDLSVNTDSRSIYEAVDHLPRFTCDLQSEHLFKKELFRKFYFQCAFI